MRISELIMELHVIKDSHGDLQCFIQDGLDPSDWDVVNDAIMRSADFLPESAKVHLKKGEVNAVYIG